MPGRNYYRLSSEAEMEGFKLHRGGCIDKCLVLLRSAFSTPR